MHHIIGFPELKHASFAYPLRVFCLQGLAIVKASLQSKTVLTDVFLGNKRPRGCA